MGALVDKGLIASLNALGEKDRLVLAKTEPNKLAGMTENDLLGLHRLVRKRRNKLRSVYRRGGAKKVKKAKIKQQNQRNADRLELFEEALERVSRALADAAARSAAELRGRRLQQ
jgi:hypothetical protein